MSSSFPQRSIKQELDCNIKLYIMLKFNSILNLDSHLICLQSQDKTIYGYSIPNTKLFNCSMKKCCKSSLTFSRQSCLLSDCSYCSASCLTKISFYCNLNLLLYFSPRGSGEKSIASFFSLPLCI